jgi:transcriptional regulator with XRE-family HTH domain
MNATEQAREITNQIIAEAKRRKLTVGQLELKWGVTKSYVSAIMRGHRVPYLGTLDRIARSMGIDAVIQIGKTKPLDAANKSFLEAIRELELTEDQRLRIDQFEQVTNLFKNKP